MNNTNTGGTSCGFRQRSPKGKTAWKIQQEDSSKRVCMALTTRDTIIEIFLGLIWFMSPSVHTGAEGLVTTIPAPANMDVLSTLFFGRVVQDQVGQPWRAPPITIFLRRRLRRWALAKSRNTKISIWHAPENFHMIEWIQTYTSGVTSMFRADLFTMVDLQRTGWPPRCELACLAFAHELLLRIMSNQLASTSRRYSFDFYWRSNSCASADWFWRWWSADACTISVKWISRWRRTTIFLFRSFEFIFPR